MKREISLRENLNCSYVFGLQEESEPAESAERRGMAKNIGAMQRQRRQRFRKEGNNEDSEWFLLGTRKQQ